MLLNEIIKKFLVPDRNDPSKQVEVHRYIIDKDAEPTAVVFGKFCPWTGPKGHGRLVDAAKKHFKNVIIVSPTRKKVDPEVDIFTDEQKQKIIEKATGLKFIRIDSSIPIRMFTRVVESGIRRPVFVVGPDRIEDFKKYFIPYSKNNKSIEDIKDPNFNKGECFFVTERGKEKTSATKVRKALLDNNKEEFLRLTGYDEDMWYMMREMLKDNKVILQKEMRMDFIRFYYLTEGGKVVVRGQPAHRIPMDKISEQQYNDIREEILETLRALNDEFQKKYNKPLFPNFEENARSGKLFSGSSRSFFTRPFEEFSKYKKSVGDIDLQYPEELRSELKKFLKDSEGKKFGKMTYFGQSRAFPTQENTIFKSTTIPGIQNIQIDFEPVQFEKGTPSEFAIFSHYSSWNDIKAKIKGTFRDYLIRSLVSAKERLKDIAVMTPTGKISTSKAYEYPSMRKFSSDRGMRIAFEPVLDDKGNIRKTEDGRSIYKEISTSQSSYERNLDNIFAFVFGKKPTPDEKKQMHSFIGMLKLAEKYLDRDMIKDVFDIFIRKMWDKNGQEIERGEFNKEGIQTTDFEIKKTAYDKFVEVFPYVAIPEKELKEIIKTFYADLKRKKEARKEREKMEYNE